MKQQLKDRLKKMESAQAQQAAMQPPKEQ